MFRTAILGVILSLAAANLTGQNTESFPSDRFPGGRVERDPGNSDRWKEYDKEGRVRADHSFKITVSRTPGGAEQQEKFSVSVYYDEAGRPVYFDVHSDKSSTSFTGAEVKSTVVYTTHVTYDHQGRVAERVRLTDVNGTLTGTKEVSKYSGEMDKEGMKTSEELKAKPDGSGWIDEKGKAVPLPAAPGEPDPKVKPQDERNLPPDPGKPAAVGLVLPADIRPGDTVTATLVTNPKDYAETPGLRIHEMTMSLVNDAAGKPSLDDVEVSLGDGVQQLATKPVTVRIPVGGKLIPVRAVCNRPRRPAFRIDIPMTPEARTVTPRPSGSPGYETPSVYVAGGVQVIRGPLSGHPALTHITVGDKSARILAASPRSVFWYLPDGTRPGKQDVHLQDSGTSVTFNPIVLTLAMNAVKLNLMRGESTPFSTTVAGPEALPESAWTAAAPKDLNPATLEQKAPGFRPPAAGSAGQILLSIENVSKDTVSISPSKNEFVVLALERKDFAAGPYTFRGTIKSKRAGGFNVNGLVVPFTTPITAPPPVPAPPPARAAQPAGDPKIEFPKDGSMVRTWPDGTREVTTDAAIDVTRPDGTKEKIVTGGTRVTKPDGTVTETYKAGMMAFRVIVPGRMLVTLFRDGTLVTDYGKNGMHVSRPSGQQEFVDGFGWEMIISPLGAIRYLPPQGLRDLAR